jgi:hypothetical protein
MTDAAKLGTDAVEQIAELWQVDASRSIRTERGFDWWPGNFRVSVTAHPRADGQEPAASLLWVHTDLLRDVPVESDKFIQLAAITSRFCTSTYAWAYPPAEIWAKYASKGESPRLSAANTAYITDDNVDWLPRFVARMSIMQPINAEIQQTMLSGMLDGGVLDISSLEGRDTEGLDDMLQLAARLYAPVGEEPSRWIGTTEFQDIADNWGRSDICFGNGDHQGLTLETPFGEDSALIRLWTDQRHPQLGNGLLCTVQLPFSDHSLAAASECAFLNFLEKTMWTDVPLFGCWHPHPSRGELESPSFSSFIPNALYQPRLASHVTLWLLDRARWVRKTRWPTLQDRPMIEILNKRVSPAG